MSATDRLLRLLQAVFRRHGIPVGQRAALDDLVVEQKLQSELAVDRFLPEPVRLTSWLVSEDAVHGQAELVEVPMQEWPLAGQIVTLPIVPSKPVDSFGTAAIGEVQMLPLLERTSARSTRFSEEVQGWKLHGISGGYGDRVPLALCAMPGGCVASISLSLEIQIADPANDSVRILPLFPAHPMCADPPMAWVPFFSNGAVSEGRLVVYSKLQNGVYIVNPATGDAQLLPLEIPFFAHGAQVAPERAAFMRARVQVAMVTTLAGRPGGGILVHVVGGSALFAVFVEEGQWRVRTLSLEAALPGLLLQSVQVLQESGWLLTDMRGAHYLCEWEMDPARQSDQLLAAMGSAVIRKLKVDAASRWALA
jgi:hypothetical protein